jgi:hypothetical protein
MTRALAVLAALAAPALDARADARPDAIPVTGASEPPDAAVEEAGDANLETADARRGLTFDAALGGGLIFGIGVPNSVGRGGALSLRLGQVANRRTVLTLELDITVALHKPAMTSGTEANTSTELLAGVRSYVSPSLWLRGGAGMGVYQGNKVVLNHNMLDDVTLLGPALLGGVGIDLARFKWAVLTLDLSTSAMINRDGVLVASGLHVGVSFD